MALAGNEQIVRLQIPVDNGLQNEQDIVALARSSAANKDCECNTVSLAAINNCYNKSIQFIMGEETKTVVPMPSEGSVARTLCIYCTKMCTFNSVRRTSSTYSPCPLSYQLVMEWMIAQDEA